MEAVWAYVERRLCPCWAKSGPCWAILRPAWAYAAPSRTHVEPCWAHLGPMLGQVGPILGLCWAKLGPCCAMLGPSWAHVGPMLGRCWPMLALCWPMLNPLGSYVGAIYVETILRCHFFRSGPPPGPKPRKNQCFLTSPRWFFLPPKGLKHRKKRCFCNTASKMHRKLYRSFRPSGREWSVGGWVGGRAGHAYNLRLPPKASGKDMGSGPAPGSKGCRPCRRPRACISILTQRCLKLICTCFPGPWPLGVYPGRWSRCSVHSGGSADQFRRLRTHERY